MPVIRDRRPLTECERRHDEHFAAFGLDDIHRDDFVACRETDRAHATGITAHGTHVALGKVNGHSLARREKNIRRPVREVDGEQLVVFIETCGVETAPTDIRKVAQRRFFDHATTRNHHEEFILDEFTNGENRRHEFTRRERQEIDERRPTRRA